MAENWVNRRMSRGLSGANKFNQGSTSLQVVLISAEPSLMSPLSDRPCFNTRYVVFVCSSQFKGFCRMVVFWPDAENTERIKTHPEFLVS